MFNGKAMSSSLWYSGDFALPVEPLRQKLRITMLDAEGTIELNEGGGVFTIPVGGVYEPKVVPTSSIIIRTTGGYILEEAGITPGRVIAPPPPPPPDPKYRYTWNYTSQPIQWMQLPPTENFRAEAKFTATKVDRLALWGGSYNNSFYMRLDGSNSRNLVLFMPNNGGGYESKVIVCANVLFNIEVHLIVERISRNSMLVYVNGEEFSLTFVDLKPAPFNSPFWIGGSQGGGSGRHWHGEIWDFKLTGDGWEYNVPIDDGWANNPLIDETNGVDEEYWADGDAVADGTEGAPYGPILISANEGTLPRSTQFFVSFDYDIEVGSLQVLVGNAGPVATVGKGHIDDMRLTHSDPTHNEFLRVRQTAAFTKGTLSNIIVRSTTDGRAFRFTEGQWRELP